MLYRGAIVESVKGELAAAPTGYHRRSGMDPRQVALLSVLGSLSLCTGWADLNAQSKAQTTIDRRVAEATALATVPGGHVKEAELEKESGHLVWSFDIAQPNSSDIIEVQVDASTGKVVSRTVETATDEARESAREKAR
jgi:hypothetical protein